ncbi:MAG: hypothetical protein PHP42_10715 [Bacteroidota bacterium]|nr:hypothetical protein [Bacteroidota bacterium]MDD8018834.1 hypothetical protein [Bacteroidota bacterium]
MNFLFALPSAFVAELLERIGFKILLNEPLNRMATIIAQVKRDI